MSPQSSYWVVVLPLAVKAREQTAISADQCTNVYSTVSICHLLCKNHDFCTKHNRLNSLGFLRLPDVDAPVMLRAASSRTLVACATRV
jgi:hypothetical protein